MRISDWSSDVCSSDLGADEALDRKLHRTIAIVASNIDSCAFNKAVANIYGLANTVERAPASASRAKAVEAMLLLVAPMVPHLAEEAWAALGREGLIADQSWPDVDPALLVEDEVTIAVQVNGKLRDTIIRSEEHTSELQSLMRISYAVFCLKKKNTNQKVRA